MLAPNIQKVTGSEEISKIKKEEIKVALGQMKNHKSPDDDNIQCEMLKIGEDGEVN